MKPMSCEKAGCALTESDSNQTSLWGEKEEWISLTQACEILAVSQATWKNWERLGKLDLPRREGGNVQYRRTDVESFAAGIEHSDSTVLKSRRNKKKRKGCVLYRDYILSEENRHTVEFLLEDGRIWSEAEIRILLTNFALQLFFQSRGQTKENADLISAYLRGSVSLGTYDLLFRDLLGKAAEDETALTHSSLSSALQKRLVFASGEDTLGFVYLSLRDVKQRKAAGAYYTPWHVADALIGQIRETGALEGKRICDPCCGTGNFLIRMASFGGERARLYGQDTDLLSIQIARINMALAYPSWNPADLYRHFLCADTLKTTFPEPFDILLGNPPWGGAFSQKDLSRLKDMYQTADDGKAESCDLFLERSVSMVKEEGLLAFVLPEAILNVASHFRIRSLLSSYYSFCFVTYLGNVFSGVQCPAVLMGLRRDGRGSCAGCSVSADGRRFLIKKDRDFVSGRFSFAVTDEEAACLEAMKNRSQVTYLKEQARFALGIVTGDNKRYVKESREPGVEAVLRGSDIVKYGIRPPRHFIRFEPKQFQQVAPVQMYRAKEKLVYRFVGEEPVFAYDDGKRLTLNSCNILIPDIPGLEIKYILAVLNSRSVSFFCRKSFRSLKLLRSHLEQIPIPVAEKSVQKEIAEKTELLLKKQGDPYRIYNQIEEMVLEAYQLEPWERQIICGEPEVKNIFLDKQKEIPRRQERIK